MAFWHPTSSPGRCRKTCTPPVCWLVLVAPYQLHILLFAKRGWGQPWARATGVEGARPVRSS